MFSNWTIEDTLMSAFILFVVGCIAAALYALVGVMFWNSPSGKCEYYWHPDMKVQRAEVYRVIDFGTDSLIATFPTFQEAHDFAENHCPKK